MKEDELWSVCVDVVVVVREPEEVVGIISARVRVLRWLISPAYLLSW